MSPTDSIPSLFAAARRVHTQSLPRFEKNVLNTSDILNWSNVNPYSASWQVLVEYDILSGRPNYFNVFQSFFKFLVFSFSLPSK